MRTSILALAAVLMVAGCGDNTPVKLDSGTKHDMSMMQTSHDMAMSTKLTCGGLIQCLNAAGMNQTAQQKCINSASKTGSTLLQAFFNCATTQCPSGADANFGTGSCAASGDTCFSCIQGGTSPTGMMALTGSCCAVTDSSGNCTTPGTGPKCGQCVDQLNACILDCMTDTDCQGITNSSGGQTTCVSGVCK